MEHIERIGISLERGLLSAFDKMIEKQGYENRSQAIGDLIRQQLGRELLAEPETNAIGTVCLVYDHHSTKLMQKLTEMQHSHLLQVICSMHVHVDLLICMEVIVLKGMAGAINKTAEYLLSQKGLKLGQISLLPTKLV